MARPKKDNRPMTVRLATPIFERLEEYCEDSGQTKTIAIERALSLYMDDYYEKQRILEEFSEKKE